MRRAHRRAHLRIWLILAPLLSLGLLAALLLRPPFPVQAPIAGAVPLATPTKAP